jgi:hypothetical protein
MNGLQFAVSGRAFPGSEVLRSGMELIWNNRMNELIILVRNQAVRIVRTVRTAKGVKVSEVVQ